MSIVDESQRRDCLHIVPALLGGGRTGRLRRRPSSTIPSASPSSGLLGFGSVALPTICNGFLTQDTNDVASQVEHRARDAPASVAFSNFLTTEIRRNS
jgi:hypothetical protein